MPVMPRPRMSAIQRRLSKLSLLSVGEGGNAGDAAAQNERKYKDDFQKDRCSQLAKEGMPVMPRPINSKIQRRLSKISLLSVGEGGNAGDQNAPIQRRLSKISLLSVGEGGNAGNAAAQNERNIKTTFKNISALSWRRRECRWCRGPEWAPIQWRLSKRSLLSVGEGGNAGDAAAQKTPIQRRLSKLSLLSVGEGGNAGNAAAQNERVNVVRALVRVHRLQVHHVSARAQQCRKKICEKILKAKKRGLCQLADVFAA
jgi:hypothetical protein